MTTNPLKPNAPAKFSYCQPDLTGGQMSPIEMYKLLEDIEGHDCGSTVSRQTLEAAGYFVPPILSAAPQLAANGGETKHAAGAVAPFVVGERLEIKGRPFKIVALTKRGLALRRVKPQEVTV